MNQAQQSNLYHLSSIKITDRTLFLKPTHLSRIYTANRIEERNRDASQINKRTVRALRLSVVHKLLKFVVNHHAHHIYFLRIRDFGLRRWLIEMRWMERQNKLHGRQD